jgi:hypothetical protein
MHLCARANT